MRKRLRPRLTYANVMVTVLAFVVLGGGAYAAVNLPRDSVRSRHILNGGVKKQDLASGAVGNRALATNAVTSGKVADESLGGADIAPLTGADIAPLTGADIASGALTGDNIAADSLTGASIAESSLGEVPSARLGGVGRNSGQGGCDPDDSAFNNCVSSSAINLSAPARVLVIGQIRAYVELGGSDGGGFCRVGSNVGGFIAESQITVSLDSQTDRDALAMSGVTGVVGPGPVAFGLDCNETGGEIKYDLAHVTYVLLSAN